MKSIKNILLFFILIFAFQIKFAFAINNIKPMPEWVKNRPSNSFFYIGIGYANKTTNNDYLKTAKENALNDLISEIKVNIIINSSLLINETNSNLTKEYKSSTKISTQNEIENYEVFDTWDNNSEYWVYIKLSKEDYEKVKFVKVNTQIKMADILLDKADAYYLIGEFGKSLNFKLDALLTLNNSIQNGLYEVNKGKYADHLNKIISSIQNQINELEIIISVDSIEGKAGLTLPDFKVLITKSKRIVNDLPLIIDCNGNYESEKSQTDNNGIAVFSNSRVSGKEKIQFLNLRIDLEKYIKLDTIDINILKAFSILNAPIANLKVISTPVNIKINSNELNLSKPLSIKYINSYFENKLKSFKSVNFVYNEPYDYKIRIESNTIESNILFSGKILTNLKYKIQVLDSKDNILFIDESSNIKGLSGIDSEGSGLDAYKKGIEQINKNTLKKIMMVLLNTKEF